MNDAHQIEEVGTRLRAMMPWIGENMKVDKAAGGEVALVGGNDKTFTIYAFKGGVLTKLW